jgi:hypothetical protein
LRGKLGVNLKKAVFFLFILLLTSSASLAVIGDVSIEGKLDVTGPENVSGLLMTGSISADSNTLNTDIVNHRVGVGTFAPLYKFDITGDLRSSRYILGTGPDLSIIPVVGGQSVISSWHGMQLVGNKQSTVDYTPVNIGGANDFSVIVPNQAAAAIGFVVQGAAAQSGNLQVWRDSASAVLVSVGPTGALTANGNVTLGDANTDLTTINSEIAVTTGTNRAVGTGTIATGGGIAIRSITVNNTLVSANSMIFISPTAATRYWSPPYISAIVAGTSFTVSSYQANAAAPSLTFNYLLIN